MSLLLRQSETNPVCLSCSAESATEAISLALHSVPHVFYLVLRRCETYSQYGSLASARAPLKLSFLHSIVFQMLLRACETRSQCVSLAPPRAPLKPSLLHPIVFHMLLRRGELLTEYHPESHKCERDKNKMVWSSLLGTGVTASLNETRKAQWQRYRDCVFHCA